MSAEIIIAVSGLIAGVGGVMMAWRAQSMGVRHDEVQLLREEVTRLHERLRVQDVDIRSLREDYDEALREIGRLRDENALLRIALHEHGIEVPAMRRAGNGKE